MTLSPVQPNDPLNRQPTAPLKPLESDDFQSQLDALIGTSDPTTATRLRPFTALDNFPGLQGDPHRPLEPLNASPAPLLPLNDLDKVPGGRRAPPSEHDQVTATARKWVAQTFYGTLLRQMRNSPFKSDLFEGGRGGQAFASMLDQQLVENMSKGTASKLTGAIARKLIGKNTGRHPSRPTPNVYTYVSPNLRA